MRLFEKKKICLLKQKIEAQRIDAHNKGRFSLFDTRFFADSIHKIDSYTKLNGWYETILGWEKICNLSYDVGVSLDQLANDNTVMIHRTNLGLDTNCAGLTCNESLYSIMNEGLKNYGHIISSGASSGVPALTLTMTPLKGLAGYINLLSSYHSNDAIVISAFPKELVDSTGEFVDNSSCNKIYDLSVEPPKVRSEFIIGAILKKNNGLDEFYTRDEIVNSFENNKMGNINR